MKITLFGFIWLAAIVLVIIANRYASSKIWKQTAIFFLIAMIFQCSYFMFLGSTGIGIQIVSAAVMSVILLSHKKTPCKTGLLRVGRNYIPSLKLRLLLFEIAFLVTVFINDVYKKELLEVLMILVYLTVAMEFSEGRLVLTEDELYMIEDAIVCTILAVGVLQVLCKMGLLPIRSLMKMLIYNDNSTNVIFNSKDLTVFYSTFMEPSYCGAALVGWWACYAGRGWSRKNAIISVGLVIAILLTKSTTAYVGFALSVAGLFFLNFKSQFYKNMLPVLIVAGIVMLLARGDLVNEVLFEKMNTASYRVRNNWNKWAMQNFLSSPYFGIGYMKSRASSLAITLLAELGVTGALPYLLLVLYMVWVSFRNKYDPIVRSHAYMVLCIITCQFIACPDLNFSPFWLSIYLYGISTHIQQENCIDVIPESAPS